VTVGGTVLAAPVSAFLLVPMAFDVAIASILYLHTRNHRCLFRIDHREDDFVASCRSGLWNGSEQSALSPG